MKKRRGVRCRSCPKVTRSATRYCRNCRPDQLIPVVHLLGDGMVSLEGITLTAGQARRLADALHDAADRGVEL
ncbi:hypothetical protein MYK68_18255 [Gordonia sp. PP30]|uniref:hypothetical protein n=1 Tax=Gordonia sp. PP30 TaxID=2935861 RepID=UPI001FFEDF41|nr:hypothetical protein [Gordonia sp. PP30]UQE74632.1 hypothetical protein MYK68_18255 [Gordonia sp. PP30]